MNIRRNGIWIVIRCTACYKRYVQIQNIDEDKPFVRFFNICYICFKTYNWYNEYLAQNLIRLLLERRFMHIHAGIMPNGLAIYYRYPIENSMLKHIFPV